MEEEGRCCQRSAVVEMCITNEKFRWPAKVPGKSNKPYLLQVASSIWDEERHGHPFLNKWWPAFVVLAVVTSTFDNKYNL